MNEMEKAIQKLESSEPGPPVVAGFGTKDGFELLLRQAKWMASSSLVPKEFKNKPENVVIALEMANRMSASPFAVMQNIYIVHGKPGWSAQFITAAANSTGKFSPLRFRISEPGPEKTVTTTITEYDNGQKTTKNISEKIRDRVCVAWAVEKATGEKLESPPVSLEMAVLEGWYSKAGSKWKTMPELMLRYRAATFFGRLYAPEVLNGMRTVDEIRDIHTDEEEAVKLEIDQNANSEAIDIEPEPESVVEPKPESEPSPKPTNGASQSKTETSAPPQQRRPSF